MIVELESNYSVAGFRAALLLISERKIPRAERDAITREQLAISALRQHLRLPPCDYWQLNVRYNNLRLGVALLTERNTFVLKRTDCTFSDGFVVIKQLNGRTYDIYGYISSKKARTSFFQDLPTVTLSERYLTRWLDTRAIIDIEGR